MRRFLLAKASKEKDKCKADAGLMDFAPAALATLDSDKVNGDVSKLTKKEICAGSFRFFGCLGKEALPKPTLLTGSLLRRPLFFLLRLRLSLRLLRLPPRLLRLPPRLLPRNKSCL